MTTYTQTDSMAANPGLHTPPLSQTVPNHESSFPDPRPSRPVSLMAGEIQHDPERLSRPQSRTELNALGSLSRKNTLQKRMSLGRRSSTKRTGPSRAGSVRSLSRQYQAEEDEDDDKMYNPLISPVPTKSNPTAILADRFQGEIPFRLRETNQGELTLRML